MSKRLLLICTICCLLTMSVLLVACSNRGNTFSNITATFDGFTLVTDNTYQMTVSNTTTTLDLNSVVTANNAQWKLTTDIQGNNTIESNICTLQIGDNTYFVLVTAANGQKKLYTLQIRRRPIYTVSFNTNGGTSISSQSIEEGDIAIQPENPTRIGFTFDSWNMDFEMPIMSNTLFTANWQANTYTITYHANNGTADTETQNAVYNTTSLLNSDIFSRTGYNFVNWNTSADGSGAICLGGYTLQRYTMANDTDLYANWQLIYYSIIYNLNGGTNGSNPNTFTITSETITLNDPTRTNYYFDGWYNESTFENRVYEIPSGSTGNIVLYAKWVSIISFDTQGGSDVATKIFMNDNAVGELETPTFGSYTFDGWYTAVNGGGTGYTATTMVNGNVTLYAKWVSVISFDTQGGNSIADCSIIKDSSIGILPTPIKTTNTFGGWYTEVAGNGIAITTTTIPTGTATIYSMWITQIVFDTQGGTTVNNKIVVYKQAISELPVPIKFAYKFVGWFLDTSFEKQYTADTIYLDNTSVILYAKWAFKYNGGTGTQNDPFTIATKEQLEFFANSVNTINNYSLNKYFVLSDNIDLEGEEWIPIGCYNSSYPNNGNAFKGNFDGNGFTISNFRITQISAINGYIYTGFFGYTLNAIINNLVIIDCDIEIVSSLSVNCYYIGGLIGYNDTTSIINCSVIGNISASVSSVQYFVDVGGLTGFNSNSSICENFANVNINILTDSGTALIGGLVGDNGLQGSNSIISNCYSIGDIFLNTTTNNLSVSIAVGGLVGWNYNEINNSYAMGNVTTIALDHSSSTGGLVGFTNGVIINSFATGNVSGSNSTGSANIGGLYGSGSLGNMLNCYRFEGQIFSRKAYSNIFTTPTNSDGNNCTLLQLNDIDFYTNTLGWSADVWDFSNLDISSGVLNLPTLKIFEI